VQLEKKNDTNYFTIAKEVTEMAQNYISGLILVIAIIAILNTTGLLILGIKYAVFLGILSALLTIIPYIGIVLGSILPILVALLTKDSLLYAAGVIAIFGLVQFLEGNFITPKIIGSKVNVNPLSAIIALIVGGAVWGIAGMILAIPILGIIQIILSNNKDLKPFASLISNN
jgi:predicted PurR-regulated permease PerM